MYLVSKHEYTPLYSLHAIKRMLQYTNVYKAPCRHHHTPHHPPLPSTTNPHHPPLPTLPKVIQYNAAVVPNMAYTLPLSANMGLFMVVSRVPNTIMRAGESRSPITPDTDFEALHKNCAIACKLPICVWWWWWWWWVLLCVMLLECV